MARVRRVVVVCANDGYVMQAWKAERGLQAWFVGDPFGKLLGALDLLLPEPDPELGPGRSKRSRPRVTTWAARSIMIGQAYSNLI